MGTRPSLGSFVVRPPNWSTRLAGVKKTKLAATTTTSAPQTTHRRQPDSRTPSPNTPIASSEPSVERTPPFDDEEAIATKIATAHTSSAQAVSAEDADSECRWRSITSSPQTVGNGSTISIKPAKWFLLKYVPMVGNASRLCESAQAASNAAISTSGTAAIQMFLPDCCAILAINRKISVYPTTRDKYA